MKNEKLIEVAASVLNPRKVGDRLFGDVGSALVTKEGDIYKGVCIDTSGLGFCAEQYAIAAMISAGEERFEKIVAVWKNEEGEIFVIAPCGHCREFMRQTNEEHMESEVILAKEKSLRLKELLPERDSWKKM